MQSALNERMGLPYSGQVFRRYCDSITEDLKDKHNTALRQQETRAQLQQRNYELIINRQQMELRIAVIVSLLLGVILALIVLYQQNLKKKERTIHRLSSELQKYSNAVSADKLDDTMKDLIANWNARPEFSFKSKDIEYNFERHEYCIIIDSGEPHNYIRTLYFLELQDSEQTRNDRKYVDGMIFNYTDATASNYLMPLNMGGEYNGDLFMILTEENGGLVENKPLNIQPDSDASINRINRVEFQLKDGMKIIYAAYLGEPSDDSSKILTANYTVQYVHRKLPIQSPASRVLIHQTGISTPAYCRSYDVHPCDV